jgi:hypothetical protein
METHDQKKDRQQKLGEKPMKGYTMTNTTIKLRPKQKNTADDKATYSDSLENVITTTVEAMTKVVNMPHWRWQKQQHPQTLWQMKIPLRRTHQMYYCCIEWEKLYKLQREASKSFETYTRKNLG